MVARSLDKFVALVSIDLVDCSIRALLVSGKNLPFIVSLISNVAWFIFLNLRSRSSSFMARAKSISLEIVGYQAPTISSVVGICALVISNQFS